MTGSRRKVWATGTVLTMAVLAVAGCSRGASDGSERAPVSPAAVPAERPAHDPSTWTLPMQAYRPTKAQDQTIGGAELKLVRRCMKGFGIDWRPESDLPPIGPRNMLDWRYGIHDPQLSAKRGYQPDATQQAKYDAALRAQNAKPRESVDTQVALGGTDGPPELLAGAGPDARRGVVAGKKVPPGGCFGEARRTLGSPTHGLTPLVQRLTTDSYPQSQQDPRVKAVFAQWSTCMRAKGFHYEAPMDANDDPRFQPDPRGVSPVEIATALADISCRDAYKVAEVWHAAETRIQQQSIAKNRAALDADRRHLDTVISKATDVLSQP